MTNPSLFLGQPGQAPLTDKDGRPTPQFAQFLASIANLPQGWGNTRLAKSGAYTVLNADTGNTIALGGNAFYTLTFGAPSGYSKNFLVVVINEDAARGKTIALSGGSTFILWPGQSIAVFNQNNVWQTLGRSRWILSASITFNVDPINGNDANDGLATGAGNALLTIQQAFNNFQQQVDFAGSSGTIQLADGTYNVGSGLLLSGTYVNQVVVTINGNAITPSNVVLSCSAGGTLATVQDYCAVSFQNLQTQSSGSGSIGLMAQKFGICDFNNVLFGTFAAGIHILANPQGRLNGITSYSIVGDAAQHVTTSGNGVVATPGITVNIPNARAFTTYATANFSGYYQAQSMTFSGAGVAGTTGTRYNVTLNGTVQTNGGGANYFPGSVAGTTATGGQYQ